MCAAWGVVDPSFDELWDRYNAAVKGLGKSGKRLKVVRRRYDGPLCDWEIPGDPGIDEDTMSTWKVMKHVNAKCQARLICHTVVLTT